MSRPGKGWPRYLARQGLAGPWQLAGAVSDAPAGVVVIPSLAEGESLFSTLASLAANPAPLCRRWQVIVVVNQSADAPADMQEQNRADLARLTASAAAYPFALAWIDAASPGRALPQRQAGVGLARKIGMDLALARLDEGRRQVLACLDADTLVEPGYLHALECHFRASPAGGAVLPYRHQAASDLRQQRAIDLYELYLRSYLLGLTLAGSPYAHASIGSAMACSADAYVQCGGMNRRPAAEDFHFLNKLAKTVGIGRLSGTTVHPSARASWRAPFGTGQSIARQLAGETGVLRFYPLEPFEILGRWLQLIGQCSDEEAGPLADRARQISPVLAEFLDEVGWPRIWPRLTGQFREVDARRQAFHIWFDGLQTLRLIHRLCAAEFSRSENPAILAPLFTRCGLGAWPADPAAALERLRQREFGPL